MDCRRELVRFGSMSLTVVVAFLSVLASPASAQPGPPPGTPASTHGKAGSFDISPPLRSIKPARPPARIKRIMNPQNVVPLPGEGPDAQAVTSGGAENIQTTVAPSPNAVTLLGSFDGVGVGVTPDYAVGVAPPDTEGEVGPNHYVQWNNVDFAIWDKAGTLLYGPAAGNTLFAGFPTADGNECWRSNDGDPIVLYDQLADRWVMSQFDVSNIAGSVAAPFFQCVAVSTSPDPLGTWYRYSFKNPRDFMNDYEKIGVWTNAYYMTDNEFNAAGNFQGAEVWAFDRSAMLRGDPSARFVNNGFGTSTTAASFLPGDIDGGPEFLPPAAMRNTNFIFSASGVFRRFTVDFVPATPTATLSAQTAIGGWTGGSAPAATCVQQSGTTQELDTLGGRLMFRAPYRNFGATERFVLTRTVAAASDPPCAAMRWWELRCTSAAPCQTNAPQVNQQSTFAPDTALARWMGSVAMDKFGGIGLAYNVSSSSTFPSIRFTGRLEGDAANTMQAETVMYTGGGSQTGSSALSRWGDYSDLTVDPIDDCTFWYTTEYLKANGIFNWSTRIGSFRNSNCAACTAPPTPNGITVTPNSATSNTVYWAASPGAGSYNVFRQTENCPAGIPVRIASGVTDLFFTDASAPAGAYYSVSAVDSATGNCASPHSSCMSAATPDCSAPPSFGGVTAIEGITGTAACGLRVNWLPGSSNCPGASTVRYSVYRSTTTPFTPAAANRIASCVVTNFYDDTNVGPAGTVFYYIVRAEDGTSGKTGACNGGNEDTNLIVRSGTSGNTAELFYRDFETGTGLDGFTTSGTGAADWRGIQTCPAHSGSRIFRFGGVGCNDDYASTDHTNAITPALVFPAGATTSRLSFWHRYRMLSRRDGLTLQIDAGPTGGGALPGTPTLIPQTAILQNLYTNNYYEDTACTATAGPALKDKPVWADQLATGSTAQFVNTIVNLDAACNADTGATNGCADRQVKIYFLASTNCTASNDDGWFLDDIKVTAITGGACATPPNAAQAVTVTSKDTTNRIEWLNPAAGAYASTMIRFDTVDYPADPAKGTLLVNTGTAGLGGKDFFDHTSLVNGTKYYYSIFVLDSVPVYSAGKYVTGAPLSTAGSLKWRFQTSAANLNPPTINSAIYNVSNDRFAHSMTFAATGGDWPKSPAPKNWKPLAMNAPSQAWSPVWTTDVIAGASRIMVATAQDGRAYCVNADTGALLWTSAVLGDALQATASAYFVAWDTSATKLTENMVFVATRNATADNVLVALKAVDGTTLWSFNNGGGAAAIGPVNGGMISYASLHRLWFASRKKAGASANTVWCLDYTDTGATLRWGADAGDVDGFPFRRGTTVYVGNNSGVASGYDADVTTNPNPALWTFATSDGPVKSLILPNFASTQIYFSTTNRVWALDDTNGTQAGLTNPWSTPASGAGSIATPSRPTKLGAFLYVGSGSGSIVKLDLATTPPGQTIIAVGSGAVGPPSADFGNSLLHAGTEGGSTYCVVP